MKWPRVSSDHLAENRLIKRNGWRFRVKGKTHSLGWWWHEGWNWCPRHEAIVLSRAWERDAEIGAVKLRVCNCVRDVTCDCGRVIPLDDLIPRDAIEAELAKLN